MLQRPNFTTIPNDFIDHYMFSLEKSSVLLFLAICRKTLGYHKDTDYLSYSQLAELSGLCNGAIKKALGSLQDAQLITVEKKEGKPNKITLRLDTLQASDKADSTENSADLSMEWRGVLPHLSMKQRGTSLLDRETKERNKEEKILVSTAQPTASLSIPFSKKNAKKQTDAELKPLILYFAKRHAEPPPRGRGFEPTINWPRDMAIMKRIRKGYKPDAIRQLIDAFFDWKGRTKTTLRDFENIADTLYGILLDKARGMR